MKNGRVSDIRAEDAAAFVMIINQIQQYVPPMIFNQLANNPVATTLAEVANRRAEIEIHHAAPTDFTRPVTAPPE